MDFERENRLLGQELDLIRYHRNTAETEVEKVQREHYMKMMNMQHEIESLRVEAYLKQMKDFLHPPVPTNTHQICLNRSEYENIVSGETGAPHKRVSPFDDAFQPPLQLSW